MNKILLDAQITEYNEKLSATPSAYATLQDIIHSTPTAPPHLHHLHNNHLLSLVPRNYRKTLAITELTSHGHSYPQSPVSHIALQQSSIDETYEQTVEQLHTANFRSQNNHLFSP